MDVTGIEMDRPEFTRVNDLERCQHNFLQKITIFSQICILMFTLIMTYICFYGGFEFFTWHPLLLSIGWFFLTSLSISMLSRYNVFTRSLDKTKRILLHWILQCVAVVFIVIGNVVVYSHKEMNNKPHLHTWHGVFGLVSIIFFLLSVLGGALARYSYRIRNYVKPIYLKTCHVSFSILTYFFGGITLITSLYTKWFVRTTGNNRLLLILNILLLNIGFWWTLAHPVIVLANRFKKRLNR